MISDQEFLDAENYCDEWNEANEQNNNNNNGGWALGPARTLLMKNLPFRSDQHHDNNSQDDNEDNITKNTWMSWLESGRPRGTSHVGFRESPELGGVPRSDRYASRDWWHNMVNMPKSAIMLDVSGPVVALGLWSTAISVAHWWGGIASPGVTRWLSSLPVTCHSLMVSALGLLLVFRTNSAYQRFVEGRHIWEKISNTARDLNRMTKIYEKEMGTEKRRRVQRLIAAFPYLLRHRIRPTLLMRKLSDTEYPRDAEHSLVLYADTAALDTDEEAAAIADSEEEGGRVSRRRPREMYWVDKRTLPWRLLPPACARAQNRPLWVCDRLARELTSVPNQGDVFTNRERLAFLTLVHKLSNAIGACERIHQTVVPLNYARHSLRTLTVWLATLPFCLVGQLGLLTGPALVTMSWMLFGVYEIGYSIEDPFQGTLRLNILCDQIRRDVLENEIIMGTAFKLDHAAKETEVDEEEELDDLDQSDGANYETHIVDSSSPSHRHPHKQRALTINGSSTSPTGTYLSSLPML